MAKTRPKRYIFHSLLLVSLISLGYLSPLQSSWAIDQVEIKNSTGNTVFNVKYFNKTDGRYDIDFPGTPPSISTWDLLNEQKTAIERGLNYWVERLLPAGAPLEPIIINIGTIDEPNAYGSPASMEIDRYGFYAGGMEQILVNGNTTNPLNDGFHGVMSIGKLPWSYQNDSQLPESSGASMELMAIHELGHIMGISGYVYRNEPLLTDYWYWMTGMLDDIPVFYGRAATAVYGDVAWSNVNQPKAIPLNLDYGYIDPAHFELTNMQMTHQMFRNYTGFMEVELAAVEDLGYRIDRRNFFGKSVYVDGQTLINHDGFFARQDGAYLPGRYNTSSYGLGLHIYASDTHLIQQANLLTVGYAGAGIRSDGSNNTLTIASDVRVHANGESGTGLLVAYGHGTTVNQLGDLQALGAEGIAARFDLGHNSNGITMANEWNATWPSELRLFGDQYSYFNETFPDIPVLSPEQQDFWQQEFGSYYTAAQAALNGPLVEQFNVTGSIAGHKAAIYISDNAHVKEINIMQGAEITGDIISRWNTSQDPLRQYSDSARHMTDLSFGRLADANGVATDQADAAFSLLYRGRIDGRESLNMSLLGGALIYQGQADVASFTLQRGAELNTLVSATPTTIKAEDLYLAAGSRMGVRATPGFTYGPSLGAQHTVLQLEGTHSLVNQSTLVDSRGSIAVGAYDYDYDNLHWQAPGLLAVDTRKTFNTERGAAPTTTAPGVIALNSPALTATNNRLNDLFTRDHQQSFPLATEEIRTGANALWVTPTYGTTRQNSGAGRVGYNLNNPGIALGYDHWLTDQAFAGLAFASSKPDYNAAGSEIDATDMTLALYAGVRLPHQLQLGARVAYSWVDYEQIRRVQGEHYAADYDSTAYTLGLVLARPIELPAGWSMRPQIAYDYLALSVDGYHEGSGTYALDVDDSQQRLHQLRTGTDITWRRQDGAELSGQLFYVVRYGDTRASVGAAFSQDPAANTFTSVGDRQDENSLGLGLTGRLPLSQAMEASLSYSALLGETTTHQQSSLNLTYRW